MNYKKITLIQIEYFLAVARYLNFTEAAKSLYVSQPSLSKQIAVLEKAIGVELFFRNKRDVRLTSAGVVLLREIGGVIEIIESSIEKSRKTDLGENTTIVIGCLDAIDSSGFLLPIVKSFKNKYPTVNLILERHSFKILREKLINGLLDMVFTLSFEIDESIGIVSNAIYRGNGIVIMDKSNPLADKQNISIKDLKDESFLVISRDESPNGFDSVIAISRKNGFTPNIVKQLPNIDSIVLSVEAGMGVAILDSNLKFDQNHNIKSFKIEDDFIDVVMLWKKENMNAAIPLFSSYIFSNINTIKDY